MKLAADHQAGRLRLVAATRKEEAARSLRERGIEVRHLDLNDAETGGLDAIQPAKPQAFYEQVVAAGYDPTYMNCVRNYFERTGNGSLVRCP